MKNSKNVFLSIIIPTFNEESRIVESLQKIKEYFQTRNEKYEIIVVDDNSTDNTQKIVNNFFSTFPSGRMIVSDYNYGKGYCVRRGMLEASGEYVLFSDADLSSPISECEKLISEIQKGFDAAIGSRNLKGSEITKKQPFYRSIMGMIFSRIVKILIINLYSDTQCGFKCFTNSCAKEIFAKCMIDSFAFDVELLYIAEKCGFKVKETPVKWHDSKHSTVNCFFDSLKMLIDIIRIRFIHK